MSGQRLCINHNGTIPIESNKSPGQGARYYWDMDEAWETRVPEVEARQIKEVNDQDKFSPNKVRANKKHNEGKL